MALIQYIQPDPVMSFRKLDRLVELSNWGSTMVVQDGIDLYNGGPLWDYYFNIRIEDDETDIATVSKVNSLD